MTDSLHDKLAKVLRLASNEGAAEEERNTALRLAQKIAFEHDLDLADINISDDPGKSHTILEERVGGYEYDWEITLYNGIARANFCRLYFVPYPDRKRVTLVGKKHHIETARQMFMFIHPQAEAEAMREVFSRGQLPRYALIAVIEWAKRHPEWFQEAEVPKMEVFGGMYVYDQTAPEFEAVKERALQDLIPLLRGDAGLHLIMELCGIAKAYASEVRPYIKRGQLAPEIVKDLKSWKYSFLQSMAWTVERRLMEELGRLAEEHGEKGAALVRQEDAQAQAYYDNLDLKQTNSERRWNPQGAAAGSEAGGRINLIDRGKIDFGQKELGA